MVARNPKPLNPNAGYTVSKLVCDLLSSLNLLSGWGLRRVVSIALCRGPGCEGSSLHSTVGFRV